MEPSADRPARSDDSTDDESPLEEIAAGVTIGFVLTVAFGLLALGVPWFWIAFPVGFAGVLPVVMGLVKLYERRRAREAARSDPIPDSTATATDAEDALETLRNRYARGEFDDEEFERRLERLLETETLEDASAFAERSRRSGGDGGRDRRVPESERERERERETERER